MAVAGVAAVLAVVAGFWAVPDRYAITVVSRAGYWMVLAGFACWLWSLRGIVRGDGGGFWRQSRDRAGVALVACAGVVLLVHERFGFKKQGHLGKVGFKFDRWLGVVLMQKSL